MTACTTHAVIYPITLPQYKHMLGQTIMMKTSIEKTIIRMILLKTIYGYFRFDNYRDTNDMCIIDDDVNNEDDE